MEGVRSAGEEFLYEVNTGEVSTDGGRGHGPGSVAVADVGGECG